MIRLANQGDAAQIAAIYRPFCDDNCVSFEITAPNAAEMASRIATTLQQFPWLVDETDGVVNGYAYATSHRVRAAYRWAVEVTIYLAESSRGRGLGRALYSELFARLREQGFYKAYAGVLIPNPPSQRFHESMGFTLVGVYEKVGFKLGEWRDVGWWVLDLLPPSGIPAEPKPPIQLR